MASKHVRSAPSDCRALPSSDFAKHALFRNFECCPAVLSIILLLHQPRESIMEGYGVGVRLQLMHAHAAANAEECNTTKNMMRNDVVLLTRQYTCEGDCWSKRRGSRFSDAAFLDLSFLATPATDPTRQGRGSQWYKIILI